MSVRLISKRTASAASVILIGVAVLVSVALSLSVSTQPRLYSPFGTRVLYDTSAAKGLIDISGTYCTANGECLAVGSLNGRPYLGGSAGGVWRSVPVTVRKSLVNVPSVTLTTVSCSDSRNCVAGGFAISSTTEHALAIVDSERDGHWLGVTALLESKDSSTDSSKVVGVACFSGGSCQALVQVLQKHTVRTASFAMEGGRWTLASYLAPSLWTERQSWVTGLSCYSMGSCWAAGQYYPKPVEVAMPYVQNEAHGEWSGSQAIAVSPSLKGVVVAGMISCPGVGNCALVSEQLRSPDNKSRLLAANDVDGSWSNATLIRSNVTGGDGVELEGVACVSAGNCLAVGGIGAKGVVLEPMAVREIHGVWGAETAVSLGGRGDSYSAFETVSVDDGKYELGAIRTVGSIEQAVVTSMSGG